MTLDNVGYSLIYVCDFKSLHSLVQFHHSSFPVYSLCSRPYWISFSFPNLPCCLSDLWAPVHSIPSPRTFFQDFCLLSAHLVSVWPCFLQEVFPDCSRLGYMFLMCALLYWTLPWSQKMLTLHYILVISLAGLRSPGGEPSLHCPLLCNRDLENQLAQNRS